MAKITGVVRITLNGELLESLPEAELDLGGDANEGVTGHSYYGARTKVMESKLTCTVVWKASTPVETIRNTFDGTYIFESDAGVSYTVADASITTPPVLKGGSGEIALEFVGAPAKPL